MTREQIDLLQRSVDRVIELELLDGTRFLGQPLFIYRGEEHPDVFLLPVKRGADGELVVGKAGQSILLEDIAEVRPVEG